MESVRIMISMNSDSSVSKMKTLLIECGYMVVDQSRDGHETLRKVRALRPDILLLDYNLPLLNGNEVSRVILEDGICDVILILSDSQKNLVGDFRNEIGFVSMIKPLNKQGLINTINLLVKSKRKVRTLEKEIQDLKSSLDTRKEVEKAKGLLMTRLNLSEPEAFKRIQKQSMDRGIPMKEIAKAIILAYDI